MLQCTLSSSSSFICQVSNIPRYQQNWLTGKEIFKRNYQGRVVQSPIKLTQSPIKLTQS